MMRVVLVLCARLNLLSAELAAAAMPAWPAFFKNPLRDTAFISNPLSVDPILLTWHASVKRSAEGHYLPVEV